MTNYVQDFVRDCWNTELKESSTMENYKHNAISLIAKTFSEKKISYNFMSVGDMEEIVIRYPVPYGPQIDLEFISLDDNSNAVFLIAEGLLNGVPKDKRIDMLETLNAINYCTSYIRLSLTEKGQICMLCDVPESCSDECLGQVCLEILKDAEKTLDDEYCDLMTILYGEEKDSG